MRKIITVVSVITISISIIVFGVIYFTPAKATPLVEDNALAPECKNIVPQIIDCTKKSTSYFAP